MKKYFAIMPLMLAFMFSVNCGNKTADAGMSAFDADTVIIDRDQFVRFETTAGNFTIKLYRETPLHRHNMVRYARHGKYDGQLFFGVQKGYKIQCGDINSVGAAKGVELGITDKPDTIASEIQPSRFYHKKGAVGQASLTQFHFSTSQQFYIVTGTKAKEADLAKQEKAINKRYRQAVKDSLTQPYADQLREWQKYKDSKKISKLNNQLNKETDAIMATRPTFKYSKAQTDDYLNNGGTPGLDGQYTVFGEVTEGYEVIEKICGSHTDRHFRPDPDVKIIRAYVIEDEPVQ
ncbi:MAG: peptidylprolyl isomerase [Bacteroidaceae bacterium]|nr:peptidylprolyl isomerase [Bacteroidaceae bacterium]